MKHKLIKFFTFIVSILTLLPSTSFGRDPLRTRLNRVLHRNKIPGRKSVYAKWLKGKTIYYHKSTLPLTPASCIKILSTATTLRWMGAKYRFTTKLLGKIKGNKMTTPLYWWSNGDPSLSIDNLIKMVSRLKSRGVRSIPKGIVIDSYYFKKRRPQGFEKWRGSKSYLTKPAAVAVESNIVSISVKPKNGGVKMECIPSSPFIKCTNNVKLGSKTKNIRASAKMRKNGKLEVSIFGVLGSNSKKETKRVRSFDPTKFTAGVLIKILRNQGIKVPEKWKRKRTPASTPIITLIKSEQLHTLVGKTNRFSNNFWAENLLKALGAFKRGTPGSTRNGLSEVYALLIRSGLRKNRVFLSNGSGLYGRSKISSKYLVKFMERLYTIPWLHKVMIRSLAKPGGSGTLHSRLKSGAVSPYLHAKTGTLSNASCLAGYLKKGNKTILFAIITDKIKGEIRKSRLIQDEIVKTLAKRLRGRKIRKFPKRLF
jgi:serine-type D-Ala-D-Ala carboxypeptidase/endopeptidase (penicillin-binding protein 4)